MKQHPAFGWGSMADDVRVMRVYVAEAENNFVVLRVDESLFKDQANFRRGFYASGVTYATTLQKRNLYYHC